MHTIVARSTFGSKKWQNMSVPYHFWKLRCRKSVRRCGTKPMWKSKGTKHRWSGPLLEVAMSKKCMPLWREAHLKVKSVKTPHAWTTCGFQTSFVWQAQGILHLVKSAKRVGFGFVAFSETKAGVGLFKRSCTDAFLVAGAIQETLQANM